ncbi:hypothetical protein MBLNU459_g6575t1 [Dothideomycetes sp. NU459]
MHSALFFANLATIALAAPTPERPTTRSFTVPRVRNNDFVRDPASAMAKVYHKYGWGNFTLDFGPDLPVGPAFGGSTTSTSTSTTEDSSSAVATSEESAATTGSSSSSGSETGTVTATPADNGAEYLCPVQIGGQTLNLDFDTGSADLWVFSTSLPSSDIGSHTVYDPSKSSTYQALDGSTFSISYGDGSGASGTVGTDTVNIGGATVTSQAIELATSVSAQFVSDTGSDGLVGLAFPSLNSVQPTAQNTFFANIMSSLEQPVFTANLESDGSGSYQFGTIDTSKYKGDITFTPVDSSSGFWQFDSNSYSIGGTTTQASGASPAIADTGTSLLLVDAAVAQAYYAQVSGSSLSSSQGGYIYPCSATLPDFAVAIGSEYMATVPGDSITFANIDSTNCFGGIQSNGGSGQQIYGDVLLKSQFVVFDGKNVVLGMANKA